MRAILLGALGIVAIGCAARGPESEDPAIPPIPANGASPAPTEVTSSPAPRTLRREEVKNTIRAGLGSFLQRVALDERPAFEGGKFKGFRIAALQGDPAFWRGVDLKPGDIVLSVNGKVIERPEQALEVFHGLASAHELRVAIERDGRPRMLVLPIEDGAATAPPRK